MVNLRYNNGSSLGKSTESGFAVDEKKEMTAMSLHMFHKNRSRSDERWFQMMRQAMLFRQIP